MLDTVVPDGEYTINDPLVTILHAKGWTVKKELTMTQKWPIRVPRPISKALPGIQAADNRTAYPGYPVPAGKGRHGGDPGRLRYRKDHDPAPDRKVV